MRNNRSSNLRLVGSSVDERTARLPKRKISIEQDDIFGGEPFEVTRYDAQLDCDAEKGNYEIDSLLPRYPALAHSSWLVEQRPAHITSDEWNGILQRISERTRASRLRERVNQAARMALHEAYYLLVDLPSMDSCSRQLNDTMSRVAQLLPSVIDADANAVGHLLRVAKKGKEAGRAAQQRVETIIDLSKLLLDHINRFYDEVALPRVARPNSNILTFHFILGMTGVWRDFTGSEVPRSKSGPFVRFVVAAWRDVGFPTTDNRGKERAGDLEDWLGGVIEAHSEIRKVPREKS
jgi:hypothetical protein